MTKKQGYDQLQSKKKGNFGDYGNNTGFNKNNPKRNRENNQRKVNASNAYNKSKSKNRPFEECAKFKTERVQRTEETINDIKEDIARIEKEIMLEITEIKSMKLGL
ncbi:MAG: hypothetical protein GX754_06505 [Clostridiaceae bacterium]|nr:hypothetical protein [Clostridiaceae bacterium]